MVQCPKGLNIPWSKRPQETFRNGSKTDEDPQFKAASFKDCLTDVHETCMTLRWRCFDPYMIGKRNSSISAEVDTLQKQKSVHQMLSRHFSWALGSHSRHSPYIGQSANFHSKLLTSWHLLVGGWPTPLKNDGVKVSWDDDISNIWENEIHVPNHQPVSWMLFWMGSLWCFESKPGMVLLQNDGVFWDRESSALTLALVKNHRVLSQKPWGFAYGPCGFTVAICLSKKWRANHQLTSTYINNLPNHKIEDHQSPRPMDTNHQDLKPCFALAKSPELFDEFPNLQALWLWKQQDGPPIFPEVKKTEESLAQNNQTLKLNSFLDTEYHQFCGAAQVFHAFHACSSMFIDLYT